MNQRFRSILTLSSFFVFLSALCLAQTGLDDVVTLSNNPLLVYDPPRRIEDPPRRIYETTVSGPCECIVPTKTSVLITDPALTIKDVAWIGRSTIDLGPLVVKETVPAQAKLIIEVRVSSEETQPIMWNGYHLTPTTRIVIPISGLIEVRPSPIVVQPCR